VLLSSRPGGPPTLETTGRPWILGTGPGYEASVMSEHAGAGYPQFRQVVLDGTDVRELAEFYRQLLGWQYRPGDEPPGPGEPDPAGQDWLVLRDAAGAVRLAFQQVAELTRTTWPDRGVPQQMHLDLYVTTADDLAAAHQRAVGLGARLLYDRSGDPEEPLRVYADPAGHPFCIFLGPPPA
jgi:Glyoxalase-like domain